jgi:hypothetical protein
MMFSNSKIFIGNSQDKYILKDICIYISGKNVEVK